MHACIKCNALTLGRAQAMVSGIVDARGTMLMLLVGQQSRMLWPDAMGLCRANQMLPAQTAAHRLLPRSIVVSSGSFQISSLILPVNRLLVTRKLMSCSFSMPTGRLPVSWLSCKQQASTLHKRLPSHLADRLYVMAAKHTWPALRVHWHDMG